MEKHPRPGDAVEPLGILRDTDLRHTGARKCNLRTTPHPPRMGEGVGGKVLSLP